ELPSFTKSINGSGYHELTFDPAPSGLFNVIYGVRSQYQLGYGFQKPNKPYSDSVRLMYKDASADSIMDESGITLQALDVNDPALYISLDDSAQETVLELYNIPLLYAPEINITMKLDPIVMEELEDMSNSDVNTLRIKFYYVAGQGYGSYYADAKEIALDYAEMALDLNPDGSYSILYNKDLQSIYDAFGTGNLDIYISISQVEINIRK
ncbi:unnamed protein product, partial [marine sediment metagenome]